MDTIIEALRQYLGNADFYHRLGSATNYSWDYGAMLEYFVGAVILCIVISSVFKLLQTFVKSFFG